MLFPYLRQDLLWAHKQLVSSGLTVWTSGNASVRCPEQNMILIKPSGVMYDDLSANSFVVVGMDGAVVEPGAGDLKKPSVDTASHLYIYARHPEIKAIVHTHSAAAVAWSVSQQPIQCVTTEQADIFGGPIPCAGLCEIGNEEIGRAATALLSNRKTGALLLANHGVLTYGASLKEAVRNAVMVEHCAEIALRARNVYPLAGASIDRYHERYKGYGQ